MPPYEFRVGTVFTPKSFEATKARVVAENEAKNASRGPINDKDIDYLNKVLDAPVELFIKLV